MQIIATWKKEHFSTGTGGQRFVVGSGSIKPEDFEPDEWPPGSIYKMGFKITGCVPVGDLVAGLEYRMDGKLSEHKKHGWSFKLDSFTMIKPYGRDGILKWICTAPGIGPTIAKRLWDQYGPEAVDRLKSDPERAASEVHGLTEKVAKGASCFLVSGEVKETVTIALIDLFSGNQNLNSRVIEQCIEKYGLNAADVIRNNPFVLLPLKGVGFPSAYRLWIDLGKSPESLECQARCIEYQVSQTSDTWLGIGSAVDKLQEFLSIAIKIGPAIEFGNNAGFLRRRGNRVTTVRRCEEEAKVSQELLRIADNPPIWPVIDQVSGLSAHQRAEARVACSGGLGVLIGSPGCGKTFVIAKIVKHLLNCGILPQHIGVFSFTGKAASRAKEVLESEGIKVHVGTMHRTLRPVGSGYDGEAWKFTYDQSNRLSFRYVLLEESSMNGVEITGSMLEALPESCNVLFVGDINQLPPVSHGAVLRDVINSGICKVGRLTEIKRNDGMIAQACADLRDNGSFDVVSSPDLSNGQNLMHTECNTAMEQIMRLKNLINFARQEGYSPIWDMQVICAVNNGQGKNLVARDYLNEQLQDLLNPLKKGEIDGKFRVGDKVICRKNGTYGGLFVANGEQGVVTAVQRDHILVRMAIHLDEDDHLEELAASSIKVATNRDCVWQLAYAITCHSSQGSEWPIVAIMIDSSQGGVRTMNREWVMTANSRAKVFCSWIGRRATVNDCCRRSSLTSRDTDLTELLACHSKSNSQLKISIS